MTKEELEKLELIGDNHVATSIETPLRKDAFVKTEDEKIAEIEGYFSKIMDVLGLDLSDDSLKGTPKRVAKMYVKEIFSGLSPEKLPKASTFNNTYNYQEMLVEKNIQVY